VLDRAGYKLHQDELANTHAWSHDGLTYVGFLPEADKGDESRALWQVRAYRQPNATGLAWTATFDQATPAELVAAFLAALTDPAAITRDPLDPAGMLDQPAEPSPTS